MIRMVIIVDDCALFRETLVKEIPKRIHNCFTLGVSTIEVALDKLQRDYFDVIILDIELPGYNPTVAADRHSVVAQVRAVAPHSLLFVLTAADSADEAKIFHEMYHINGYLSKTSIEPGDFSSILTKIKAGEFCTYFTQINPLAINYSCSGMREKEYIILKKITKELNTMELKKVYLNVALELNLSEENVEKQYKTARKRLKKFIKNGSTLLSELWKRTPLL